MFQEDIHISIQLFGKSAPGISDLISDDFLKKAKRLLALIWHKQLLNLSFLLQSEVPVHDLLCRFHSIHRLFMKTELRSECCNALIYVCIFSSNYFFMRRQLSGKVYIERNNLSN